MQESMKNQNAELKEKLDNQNRVVSRLEEKLLIAQTIIRMNGKEEYVDAAIKTGIKPAQLPVIR